MKDFIVIYRGDINALFAGIQKRIVFQNYNDRDAKLELDSAYFSFTRASISYFSRRNEACDVLKDKLEKLFGRYFEVLEPTYIRIENKIMEFNLENINIYMKRDLWKFMIEWVRKYENLLNCKFLVAEE